MADTTTFTGSNGEVTVEVDGSDVTITLKPKDKNKKPRKFRPHGKRPINKLNKEPTGQSISLYGDDDVRLVVKVLDNCTVECDVEVRHGFAWELDYSFLLEGLSEDDKKKLLKKLDSLPISWVMSLTGASLLDNETFAFAARLDAPGEVRFAIGRQGVSIAKPNDTGLQPAAPAPVVEGKRPQGKG